MVILFRLKKTKIRKVILTSTMKIITRIPIRMAMVAGHQLTILRQIPISHQTMAHRILHLRITETLELRKPCRHTRIMKSNRIYQMNLFYF